MIFSYQTLQAQDTRELNNDIKRLVLEIKKAHPSQKRVLINKLKVKVRTINKLKRVKIIKEIKKSLSQKSNNIRAKKPLIINQRDNMESSLNIIPIIQKVKIQKPKVETPIIKEEPKIEIPKVKVPVVIQEPKIDNPIIKDELTIETPKIPKIQVPVAPEPKIEMPKIDNPIIPTVNEPKIAIPKVEVPEVISEPRIETPQIEVPTIKEPLVDTPAFDKVPERPIQQSPHEIKQIVEPIIIEVNNNQPEIQIVQEEPIVQEPTVQEQPQHIRRVF